MKIKKFIALMSVAAILAPTFSFVGCGDNELEAIDEMKTQFYIGNYEAGMGSKWLDSYEIAFEKAYENVSFEDGKTGVQIIVNKDKTAYTSDSLYENETMTTNGINLFFCDSVEHRKFVKKGWVEDITDVVKEILPGETKSIEDKLTADQKSYYQVDGKYYSLPHYNSFGGIVYDIDLFEERGYYFDTEGEIIGVEITDAHVLSNGPDGKPNSSDDGLPATYDEFFKLCAFIKADGVYPITWTGMYRDSYTQILLEALAVDYEGAERAKARYSLSQESIKTEIVSGFNAGDPIVVEQDISQANYHDIYKLAGTYYAASFLEEIMLKNYYYKNALSSVHSHEMTQYEYLYSRFDSAIVDKPIAMLIEGTWWEEEASATFAEMAENFDGAARNERRFGFMNLPKVNETKIGKTTLLSSTAELIVNKYSSQAQIKVAKEFIKFISTDEKLKEFHMSTGIGRDYQYELDSDEYAELSGIAKQIYDMKNDAEIARPDTLNDQISEWYDYNKSSLYLYRSRVGNNMYYNLIFALEQGATAAEYFQGIPTYNIKT